MSIHTIFKYVFPNADMSSTIVVEAPTKAPVEDLSSITDDRKRPLPPVMEFECGKASNDEIIKALIVTGAVIIRNAVAPEHLDQIEHDLRPELGDPLEASDAPLDSFFSKESKRILGLPGKSKAYMEQIVQHPTYKAVRDELLTAHFKHWWGGDLLESHSKPQLNTAIVFSVRPGAKDQSLHRDDVIAHNVCRRKTAAQYEQGQDTAIGWFVAGKPSTKANGATRFIPGSHLWDHMTPPDESLTVPAELNRGDAMLLLASTFHGASANNTTDQERLIYSAFFTKSFLRQEENLYISVDPEKLLSMGYDEQTLYDVGYGVGDPFSGYCDMLSPLEFLKLKKEKAA